MCKTSVRALNRAVIVGETRRSALNSLAVIVPAWLDSFASPDWHARYDHRVEESRLPRDRAKRISLVEAMGTDGSALLTAIYTTPELQWLHQVPAGESLRRVWVQQFESVEGQLHFRADDNIPPAARMMCSPYDLEAPYGRKRTMWWVGYKVHVTETCE